MAAGPDIHKTVNAQNAFQDVKELLKVILPGFSTQSKEKLIHRGSFTCNANASRTPKCLRKVHFPWFALTYVLTVHPGVSLT